MTVSPVGNLSQPLHQLRDALIASASWQSWAGGSGPAQAGVYFCAAPARVTGPHIIVDWDSDLVRPRDGIRIARFPQAGSLLLYFTDSAGSGLTWADAMTTFLNKVDAVLGDIEVLPQNGGQSLVIDSYQIAGGPSRIPALERDKHGDMLEILFTVRTRGWQP